MTQLPRDAPQFYLTAPTPCPYLPGRLERKVFTHLVGRRARASNDALTRGGFRRSQTIAYRPACEACRACVSVRVPVADFRPSRSQRRALARNSDVVGTWGPARATSEGYGLFRAYLDARHGAGGMADMSVLDYAAMVEEGQVETRLIEYRARGMDSAITGRGAGPLLACSLVDLVEDGLSMVYSFYEPEAAARGLGTLMILDHVARARARGLSYVYLGYWIEGSGKMAYKAGFLPQERLTPRGWERVERG